MSYLNWGVANLPVAGWVVQEAETDFHPMLVDAGKKTCQDATWTLTFGQNAKRDGWEVALGSMQALETKMMQGDEFRWKIRLNENPTRHCWCERVHRQLQMAWKAHSQTKLACKTRSGHGLSPNFDERLIGGKPEKAESQMRGRGCCLNAHGGRVRWKRGRQTPRERMKPCGMRVELRDTLNDRGKEGNEEIRNVWGMWGRCGGI